MQRIPKLFLKSMYVIDALIKLSTMPERSSWINNNWALAFWVTIHLVLYVVISWAIYLFVVWLHS